MRKGWQSDAERWDDWRLWWWWVQVGFTRVASTQSDTVRSSWQHRRNPAAEASVGTPGGWGM